MTSEADSWEPRNRLHARLATRNRIVGVLRWLVPALGLLVGVVLLAQIVITSLSNQFGLSDLRIDRDKLVVETPRLSATGSDGTVYAVSAVTASTAIGAPDRVDMTGARVVMLAPEGGEITATAPAAQLQTIEQVVRVAGATSLAGDDGMEGSLDELVADFAGERLQATGAVALKLADGTSLDAASMAYEGHSATWSFEQVTLVLPVTPGEFGGAQQ